MTSVDLPPPETPVMQVKVPSGISAVTFLRLLPFAPTTLSMRLFDALAALGGTFTDISPVRYLPVSDLRVRQDLRRRSLGDDLAAMDAGAGADVEHVIGLQDRILVMLHHDHGVAEVAQALEGDEQALVVALVQADRGLVEHVEHAREAGADLARQADALALAARQGAGGARERQVFETHIDQEGQPLANLLQDPAGDLVLLAVSAVRQLAEPFMRIPHRQARGVADIGAGDLHRQRFRLQTLAFAGRARRLAHVAADLLARPVALGFLVAAFQIGDDALERLSHLVGAQAVVIGHADLGVARAEEDHLAHLSRGARPRASSSMSL